jgi:hypothetical protein
MFNKNFYPTTRELIAKMVSPYSRDQLKSMSILEPEAGKADIPDYLTQVKGVPKENIYCIELDPELRFIVQGKGYNVIHDDFLTYESTRHFDLIIMNPPFDRADEHLIKAWECIHHGDIVCLLNAETLKNPHTERRRQLARVIQDGGGKVEYIGGAFAQAERRTLVETALVRLYKRAESKFDFNFGNTTREKNIDLNAEIFGDPVALRDVVGDMIARFDVVRETYVEYLRMREKLQYYAQGLTNDIIRHMTTANELPAAPAMKYNRFTDLVRGDMWQKVFKAMDGMDQLMTYNVQKDFQKFCSDQGAMEFTRENVWSMIEMLHMSKGNIMEKAIIQVFDLLTSYHDENRIHVEGWKTNDKYKVNQKIILPHVVSMGYNGHYEANMYRETYRQFEDIDKVMCYLTGEDFENLKDVYKSYHLDPETGKYWSGYQRGNGLTGTIYKTKIGHTGWVESRFFYIRCFKKGTIHLKFKDRFLWEEFNMRACAGKKWLPEKEERAWREKKAKQKPKPQTENRLMIAAAA